jgi:hypothetical protein
VAITGRLEAMEEMRARHNFLSCEPNMLECAEKVEAMLSTAVMHQEDLWEMLMVHFPEEILVAMGAGNNMTSTAGAATGGGGGGSGSNNMDMSNKIMIPMVQISRDTLSAMKAKLESSLDWCQLAQTRLQEVIVSSKESMSPPGPQAINYHSICPQP